MPEPIQIVEIKQPLCTRLFGSAPCTATGVGDQKCYNTRSTCRDPDNFEAGNLSLFFSTGSTAERGVDGAPYIIPSLAGVSTTPTQVNLAGSSSNAQGLGTRALCTVTFRDHQHTDRRVDPYLSDRSWNPMDKERGTFWQRWAARNKYRQNIQIVIHEGFAGQTLAEMSSRTYFLEKYEGGKAGDTVSIQGMDVLARAEERKAQAPLASPGVLYADIVAGNTSFEVANAVNDDYQATDGVLRIGDEIIQYAARGTTENGVTFTGCIRGAFETEAQDHSFDTAVQQCLYYDNVRADDIVKDLLQSYAGIDAAWIDSANWADEFDEYSTFYVLTALITEPEAVASLVSELAVQVGFYIWWDERDSLIKWKAIRGVDTLPPLLTESAHIVADSFSVTEQPKQRVSQVWIYHNRTDFIKSTTDFSAYQDALVIANLEVEGEDLYGEQSIRTIYGRWLNTGALAGNTGSKILTRYVDTPRSCQFDLDVKDRVYWVGDTVRIKHHKVRDEFGDFLVQNWTIVSAEEVRPGELLRYVAEDTTLYGRIHYIMASGSADYDPSGINPAGSCFIGDAVGLLSDGTNCGRIT